MVSKSTRVPNETWVKNNNSSLKNTIKNTAADISMAYLKVVRTVSRILGSESKDAATDSRSSLLALKRFISSLVKEKKAASTADAHAERNRDTTVKKAYSRF